MKWDEGEAEDKDEVKTRASQDMSSTLAIVFKADTLHWIDVDDDDRQTYHSQWKQYQRWP